MGGIFGKLSLAAQSITLLFRRSASGGALRATVLQKYSEQVEVDEHRRQAIAGPDRAQARFLENHLTSGARVVDIGCAAGRYCLAVHARGHRVIGVDLTESMIREARALAHERGAKISFCVMDARALALDEQSFDTALMLGSVLSHVPGHEARIATLREAHRVLKPGGTLLVETQSRASARSYRLFFRAMASIRRALEAVGRRPAWEIGDRFGTQVSGAGPGGAVYFHMYAPDELEADLRDAGFEPRSVETTLYLMRYVATKRPSVVGRRAG